MEAGGVVAAEVATCSASKSCKNTSATAKGVTWKRGDKTYFRCQDCGKGSKCLRAAPEGADQETVDDWAELAPEDKARFKEQMVGVEPDGWPQLLKTFVAEAQSIVW